MNAASGPVSARIHQDTDEEQRARLVVLDGVKERVVSPPPLKVKGAAAVSFGSKDVVHAPLK
jgi:hypothetical protein